MKRFFPVVLGLVLLSLGVAAVFGAGRDHYAKHKKPGSSMIELCEPLEATGSAIVAPVPNGKQLRLPCNFAAVLRVTSAPSGGTPSLSVWFQHSADEGQTWQDFACVNATTSGSYYVPISTAASGWKPVNFVGFETGDFSQCASQTNATITPTHVLDGQYSVQLNRNNSVANVTIRQSGTTYYNLPTAYYRFLFMYSYGRQPEGGPAPGCRQSAHLSRQHRDGQSDRHDGFELECGIHDRREDRDGDGGSLGGSH